jgi:hypothetical protein
MNEAILAKVHQVLNGLGQANPGAGGTDTLFKFLKQINDYVDTLETKLGLNTDASGTTSVFARLAQIAAYVDTLETSVGSNTDGSGTSTIFARLAQIAALSGAIPTNTIKPRTTKTSTYSHTSGNQTIFNISGAAGRLENMFWGYTGSQPQASFTITVDGVQIANTAATTVTYGEVVWEYSSSGLYLSSAGTQASDGVGIEWKNSIAITCNANVTGTNFAFKYTQE